MEVAVGTVRLASMFSTMRMAPPRIGCAMSPGRIAGTTSAFDLGAAATAWGSARTSATGAAAGWAAGADSTVAGVTATGAAGVVTFGEEGGTPVMRAKYSRQLGSTEPGSLRKSSSRSRAKK